MHRLLTRPSTLCKLSKWARSHGPMGPGPGPMGLVPWAHGPGPMGHGPGPMPGPMAQGPYISYISYIYIPIFSYIFLDFPIYSYIFLYFPIYSYSFTLSLSPGSWVPGPGPGSRVPGPHGGSSMEIPPWSRRPLTPSPKSKCSKRACCLVEKTIT